MRITRKTYEKARTVVEKAREQIKLVKAWEDATRRLGNIGNQQLVAITVSEDGFVRTECELVISEVDATVSESKPQ
jgi:hypothetical protein